MKILSLLLVFFGYMLFSTANWIPRKFGEVSYEQIIFHLNVPLDTEIKLVYSYLQNTLLMSSIITVILYFVARKISPAKCLGFAVVFFLFSLVASYHKMDVSRIINEYHSRGVMGDLYEKNYADTQSVKITPPAQKRNLIMIFAESMDVSYANPDYFGVNLIPELQEIAQNNISFSHTEGFGGFSNIIGANYTQASLVSQLCAVPLKLPFDARRYHPTNGFLPGATCLPDILAKEGYKQSFLNGMTREFAGTDKFIETHGKAKILDWDFYSKRDNLSPKTDPRRKRTVRDAKLFAYAKEELALLSKQDKPFFMTLMTLDTHFGNEHFSKENCQIKYHDAKIKDEEYFKNVVSCSSLQISAFVDWLSQQPFYENTEIVIVGDHPTMSSTIFSKDMERPIYNVYINTVFKETPYAKNRHFTALDTMPTILEGLGYKIDGHKLGLGVSLFSGEQTLLEKLGLDTLNSELEKQSAIYNKLLYGKEID